MPIVKLTGRCPANPTISHRYIVDVIQLPSTFEQLRTTAAGDGLRALVDHLGDTCTNPAIVNALL